MTISVVIPSYNRAHRLPAAIDSVLRQGHRDLEVIVVDDGSADDTRQVAARYPVVKYVYQANAGVGAARNMGIRHAAGDFIAFLDSDDRWLDFKLDAQLALFAARPDVGLVFSEFVIEQSDGSRQSDGAARWAGRVLDFPAMAPVRIVRPASARGGRWPADSLACRAGAMYAQLLNELPILTSSVVVRRTALDESTCYTERVALFEDWEFFARVARRAPVGFVAAATTVNVGHDEAGRVSACSAFDRADSYRTLLERVWLADPEFVASHGDALRSAHGRALLAVAREALLAGHRDRARAALAAWREVGSGERRAWAAVYRLCAAIGGGRGLLRSVLRGQTVTRLLLGSGRGYGAVNPAA